MLPATLLSSFATKIQSKWTGIGRTSFHFVGNRNISKQTFAIDELGWNWIHAPSNFRRCSCRFSKFRKTCRLAFHLTTSHDPRSLLAVLQAKETPLSWSGCHSASGCLETTPKAPNDNQVATWHVSCSSQGNAQPFHKHFNDATSWQLFMEEGTMYFSNLPTFALRLRN